MGLVEKNRFFQFVPGPLREVERVSGSMPRLVPSSPGAQIDLKLRSFFLLSQVHMETDLLHLEGVGVSCGRTKAAEEEKEILQRGLGVEGVPEN